MRARAASQRLVRPKPAADTTSEVQLEDILLEVYADTPDTTDEPDETAPPRSVARPVFAPPPTSRSPSFAPFAPPAQSFAPPAQSFAPPAQSFAPVAPPNSWGSIPPFAAPAQPNSWGSIPPVAFHRNDETPSVSPVMVGAFAPPARPVLTAERSTRAVATAIWGSVLLVTVAAVVCAGVVAVRDGTYARLRDSAKTTALEASPGQDVSAGASEGVAPPAVASPVVAPPSAVAPPSPVAAPVPTISVDALPKSPVPPTMALVTLPGYAHGHRVYVDGRVIAVTDGVPTKIKCGRHTIKIGSARRARAVDLACGSEVLLK